MLAAVEAARKARGPALPEAERHARIGGVAASEASVRALETNEELWRAPLGLEGDEGRWRCISDGSLGIDDKGDCYWHFRSPVAVGGASLHLVRGGVMVSAAVPTPGSPLEHKPPKGIIVPPDTALLDASHLAWTSMGRALDPSVRANLAEVLREAPALYPLPADPRHPWPGIEADMVLAGVEVILRVRCDPDRAWMTRCVEVRDRMQGRPWYTWAVLEPQQYEGVWLPSVTTWAVYGLVPPAPTTLGPPASGSRGRCASSRSRGPG